MSSSDSIPSRLSQLSEAKRALLEQRLRGNSAGAPPPVTIPRRPRHDSAVLSFAQQRLWFLDQLEPGSPFYSIPVAFHLRGPLDAGALEQSLNAVVQRHEVLRTTFVSIEGQPHQVIAPTLTAPLPLVDLRDVDEAEREREVVRLVEAAARQPFDLARGPLLRAQLLRLAPEVHTFALIIHHSVCDEWALGILFRELSAFYNAAVSGQTATLPELPIQYADFAAWQQEQLQGATLERQLAYWRERLHGPLPVLELPTDQPRPARQTFRGTRLLFEVPADIAEGLQALSRREGATLFMTLMAAFQTMLARYSGQSDISVGTPVAGRSRIEIEDQIGLFFNTLVLRADLSGDPTFRALLGQVREAALGAYAHQDLPFEKLVEELQPERDPGRNPIFQVLFDLHNVGVAELQLVQITARSFEIDSGTSKFDLSLVIAEQADGLAGALTYNTDLFEHNTIARMAGHLQTLLASIVANPDQRIGALQLLTAAEREELLGARNRTEAAYPRDWCVHQFIEAQVSRTPDAIAAIFGDQHLSYRALETRANQLAHHLRELGVGPGVCVGICVTPSFEMLIGLMGIFKAGGAFVPLDPRFPPERMAYILADAQVATLITNGEMRDWSLEVRGSDQSLVSNVQSLTVLYLDRDWPMIARQPATNPDSGVTAEHLAYLIYTSGSTGNPKGVLIPHWSIVNYLAWCAVAYGAANGRGAPVHASIAADAIFPSVFAPLWVGTSVLLFPEEQTLETLARAIETGGRMSFMKITPSHLEVLNYQLPPADASGWVGTMVVGAEAVRSEVLRYWQTYAPAMPLINEYGPTETVVGCSIYLIPAGATFSAAAPIGLPIANLRFYVLDRHMQPVPIGVPGELYIGGDGVAWGYHNRPALTAEKFVPDPFGGAPGARMYRSGNIVRYLPDREANIAFLGRGDDQVKIRGYRVELGEIEGVLDQHPRVREVVVLAREDRPGEKQLVAYIVPNQEQRTENKEQRGEPGTIDADHERSSILHPPSSILTELRAFLREKLPDYMMPAAFVLLDAIPLAPHGKINRAALPAPDAERPDLDADYIAPRTPIEQTLAEIWSQVLGIERVGIDDNFFVLGGHSLLATQIMARACNAFQMQIPLRSLFEAPTIAGLGEIIAQQWIGDADPDALSTLLAEIEGGGVDA